MISSEDTPKARIRLGVLQAGRVPDEMADQHADYDQLFVDLLGANAFDYRHWAVLDGKFPSSTADADAWLITGSRFGTYEDHDWIPPLEKFIREVFAADQPMVGICFGHQIIAQAMGGRVEKFSDGWSVGRVEYNLDKSVFGTGSSSTSDQTALLAFNQDQVVQAPESSITVGSTDFCQHAALLYGNRALTLQPHPEFYSDFIDGLLVARRAILPPAIVDNAAETLALPIVRESIANTIRKFLKRDL
jgi:GMP synthase-like glutamine amidotransferase